MKVIKGQSLGGSMIRDISPMRSRNVVSHAERETIPTNLRYVHKSPEVCLHQELAHVYIINNAGAGVHGESRNRASDSFP